MSYYQQANAANMQHSPHYHQHQISPAMMPHASNVMRAQPHSPTSPYTNPSATPTTSHQQSQIRYQQQQQQSPYQQYQYQTAPMNVMNGIKVQTQQQHNMTRSPHVYHTTRSPSTTPSTLTATTHYATAPPPQRPTNNALPAYSSSTDSNQNTPQSQRSRFSPTIGSEFPDTLPVLDEQHHHSFNMEHPQLITAYSSNESNEKKAAEAVIGKVHDANMDAFDLDHDSDCEPIPSDEQKLSSSSTNGSIQRLIEQETPSERAFLQQLSQMVLDETNIMSEIDEQMAEAVQSEEAAPTAINRSMSHGMALRLNMKAATISTRYDGSRAHSMSHLMMSPPRIKMPTANNMISCSSTATTPSTTDCTSPVTPNRGYYQRAPLSVTTTPNSYQYRQRQHQYATQYGYALYNNHNNYPRHHLGSNLYSQNQQSATASTHPQNQQSATPTPCMNNRLRSKSAAVYASGSGHQQVSHHAHYAHHQGSMTPQHHRSNSSRRCNGNNNNSNYGASRTDKIYSLLQQNGNCMKLSQFTSSYPQQFHEMLPTSNRDNNLLKYLVQLPRILVIKCKKDEDIKIFYCSESSHRTVIDILRENEQQYHDNKNKDEYKGMLIDEFTVRLSEKLGIDDLSDCNMVDFLGRWRVVELVSNNKYVRLMPMGSCTVFLGNLNPQIWNEDGVRRVLTQINGSWYNLRIRLNQTNYGLLNAFIDFKSMKCAQSAIHEIKNHLALFESKNAYNNNIYNNNVMEQQQQQQQHIVHKADDNNNNSIRVEIEQASAHKNVANNHHHHHHHHKLNHHHNNNNNKKQQQSNHNHNQSNSFSQITTNIYKLIRESSGQMLMSSISSEYEKKFGSKLEFDGNPKYFVRMERLLLLNCIDSDDVMIFFTPEPAYKLVVTILKQNPSGLSVEQFKTDLERRMSMALTGCDFNDFLMRWRFLSIRECGNNKKMVLFTPHSGSTVFFGNLNVECTENDIYNDLESADASWKHSSVRLKLGKGFAYAFVDFPTRHDAMKAVQYFDGKQAFKSKYVSADIEAIEQRKRHHNHHHHHHNSPNHQNKSKQSRMRSYSHGNSPSTPQNTNKTNQKQQKSNQKIQKTNHNNNNSKTTVYLGNLRDDVTKNDIQNELKKFNASFNHLTIRLNLRSGWSHAFVDFEQSQNARKLISNWNNRPNTLTATRLRCEISKRQM